MRSDIHKKYQLLALRWLRGEKKCHRYAEEIYSGGRINDVVGFNKKGESFCIEVKVQQQDISKGRQQQIPKGKWVIFDHYYLLPSSELKVPKQLWKDWGILCIKSTLNGCDALVSIKDARKQRKTVKTNRDLGKMIANRIRRRGRLLKITGDLRKI